MAVRKPIEGKLRNFIIKDGKVYTEVHRNEGSLLIAGGEIDSVILIQATFYVAIKYEGTKDSTCGSSFVDLNDGVALYALDPQDIISDDGSIDKFAQVNNTVMNRLELLPGADKALMRCTNRDVVMLHNADFKMDLNTQQYIITGNAFRLPLKTNDPIMDSMLKNEYQSTVQVEAVIEKIYRSDTQGRVFFEIKKKSNLYGSEFVFDVCCYNRETIEQRSTLFYAMFKAGLISEKEYVTITFTPKDVDKFKTMLRNQRMDEKIAYANIPAYNKLEAYQNKEQGKTINFQEMCEHMNVVESEPDPNKRR